MASSRKFIVAKAADITEGQRLLVNVNGREVVIFRQGGALYGLINACPHRSASLCEGRFQAAITSSGVGEYEFHSDERLLACPWHGWEFDIKTGQSYLPEVKTKARRYPVEETSAANALREVEVGDTTFTPDAWAEIVGDETPSDGRVPGPYRAEAVPVTEDDSYVIVDMAPPRPARARPARVD